ncbi:transglutaminase family protein [Magnetospirillum fulvum]|uniref:Transglutaminase-like enzyme n=1 Tax=Magnetospirillum fulvum MGU-K5 TaxID=1316936 RepID=S9SBY9_MAGFU|nr:transglutaminase family protein [Magnetospirillum fulvum]EPY02234.1 transglutaminase-like enzyme [Magnetospirillum fulvum MGU-K5]
MKYRVRHLTRYHYGAPVSLSHHAAHLRPRGDSSQRHHGVDLDITPFPAVLKDDRLDYFGNPTTFFTIQEPHTTLEVEVRFVVETHAPPPLPADGGGPWETTRDRLTAGTGAGIERSLDFLHASSQVPLLAQAAAYAAPSFPPGRPLAEAVLDLVRRIHTDFVFDPDATSVGIPLAEVFSGRRGVCQDFAHVGIACLRATGLAARYVSGYIRTLPPPGQEKLQGADASHAWLSVFLPGWGWLEVDPTNDMIAGEDHVVVAWGRDYDDVSPIRGVVLGGGDHHVEVAVDVDVIRP